MLKSMTGFGRRQGVWRGHTVTVEVRSVNHRFCEIAMKLPKGFGFLEEDMRTLVRQRCTRGRIELSVTLANNGLGTTKIVQINHELAAHYFQALQALRREFRLSGGIDLPVLAGFRDIFSVVEKPLDMQRLGRVILRLGGGAVRELELMRQREGRMLLQEIRKRLLLVRRLVRAIQRRTPVVAREAYVRMKQRIQQLLEGSPFPAQDRLSQEAAILAERCDVTEELTRLRSHLVQFTALLHRAEPVGRSLDFLLQEMSREVNTIGAKANDATIALHVVELKGELEKIREQVQNIE
ncbi:MAG: YicC family protein [Nitrospirae bacterium]|nr:MAG: YicC family protein [Nitrospirota bacterium]